MYKFSLGVSVFALSLLTACATNPSANKGFARPAGGHGVEAFLGSYDATGSGKVTFDEYMAIREQRFRDADTNGDGVLSEEEYVAEFESRLKEQYFNENREPDEQYANSIKQAHVRYAIVNRARDGRYTPAEDRAIAERTFNRLDTNKDGVVSRDDPQPPRPTRTQRDDD